MDTNSTISKERLELIYESALRQFRSGRGLERVVVNLQAKGLEEEDAQKLANQAYYCYREEAKRQELHENYSKPLISLPTRFLKAVVRGLIAWVLSILTGHLINPKYLKNHGERRVE